jgi:diguanylate cyclase (GGDEF)-like protein/PAS domain S-box-containing protein
MADRAELLESALDGMQDGIALIDMKGEVSFWNQAAEEATGYEAAEVVGHTTQLAPASELLQQTNEAGRGTLLTARHKLGHEMQVMARVLALRDGLGERIGAAIVFHPAERLNTLPHGRRSECAPVTASAVDFEEYLRSEFEDCAGDGLPFGILWIRVDQAERLRKTHGAGACEAMLTKLEHALAVGLRPSEILGRWGDDEFLIISHEHTAEMFAAHARTLVWLARKADFRWWGDRVLLTVSIGAAQACLPGDENLAQLLERAQGALEISARSGGNCVTQVQGEQECLRS